MYELDAPGYFDGTPSTSGDGAITEEDRRELDKLGEAIHEMWEWQWTEDVDEQWVRAERELRAVIGGDTP